jgi:MFS family permease
VFIAMGFAYATWASRIPAFRDRLDLSPTALGLVLLSIAAGSLIALPLAGTVVTRVGSRRAITVMAVVVGASLLTVAVGYSIGVAPVVVGLFVYGFAVATWDVAMNVQGAVVERLLGRSIMPRFHAGFSVGAVAGALLGACAVALHVPVSAHLGAVAVASALCVPIAVRRFVPDREASVAAPSSPSSARATRRGRALARWREPRTLAIGLCVLAFAFAEGAGTDWISIAMIDGHHSSAALGTLGYATFLAAMTAARWFAPALLDRHGRVVAVRTLALVGIVGALLFVLGPNPAIAFIGTALWGVGASLGFPVGMSAAADDPAAAAARVSVVASIGYCAFLAGPPAIGFLGDHSTVLHALGSVAALLSLAVLTAGALRPERVAAELRPSAPAERAPR